jgi:hypothetical protein
MILERRLTRVARHNQQGATQSRLKAINPNLLACLQDHWSATNCTSNTWWLGLYIDQEGRDDSRHLDQSNLKLLIHVCFTNALDQLHYDLSRDSPTPRIVPTTL